MPKTPIDFSKTIIYKIWKDDDFYVGSTTDFATRKTKHKSACNSETGYHYNLKVYQTIREKGGWDTWEMTPLEEYVDCQNKIQARIREEEWRVKLNASLNARKSYISNEELKIYFDNYHQNHKEEEKAYSKQYRQDHIEEIKAKKEVKCNCDCGGKYTISNKSYHLKSKKHQAYLAK